MRGGGRDAYVAAYDACTSDIQREAAKEDPWVADLANKRRLTVRFGSLFCSLFGTLFGYSFRSTL